MPVSFLRIVEEQLGGRWAIDLPYGAIIGTVQLESCVPTTDVFDSFWFDGDQHAPDDYWCGDFGPGRYAWRRGAYNVFKQPIPYIGRQNFFTVPDDIIRAAA